MEQLGVKNNTLKHKLRTVFLSSLGGGLEFYDFIIFAIFANQIGANFFPTSSELVAMVQSFAVFASGYLVRPIGGLVFSHYGDKYGRKRSFAFSISLMAISTLMMSLTPSYEQWGIWGTCTFIGFRLLQGLSIGGEIPGALTFISEHVHQQKGAACAVILLFLNIGILLGDLVHFLLQKLLAPEQFTFYGWRIAFLIGGCLAMFSFYMRKTLQETDHFLALSKRHAVPIVELLQNYKSVVIKAIFITGTAATVVSIYLLFINAYLQNVLHYPPEKVSALVLVQLVFFLSASFIAGFLSDKLGARRMLICIVPFLIFEPFVVFHLLSHKLLPPIWVLGVNAIFIASYSGVMPCLLTELFPVSIRYTGIALSYNCGFAIFGGTSPVLASLLINTYQWSAAPAAIVSASALLAFVSLIMLE